MSRTVSCQPSQIPVTVLTGYLGAGKTTLSTESSLKTMARNMR